MDDDVDYDDNIDFAEEFFSLHGKLDFLINDDGRLKNIVLAEKVRDKFDDYMKNVDKLNSMINELKGVAAMTRSELHDFKGCQDTLGQLLEEILAIKKIVNRRSQYQKKKKTSEIPDVVLPH